MNYLKQERSQTEDQYHDTETTNRSGREHEHRSVLLVILNPFLDMLSVSWRLDVFTWPHVNRLSRKLDRSSHRVFASCGHCCCCSRTDFSHLNSIPIDVLGDRRRVADCCHTDKMLRCHLFKNVDTMRGFFTLSANVDISPFSETLASQET